MYNKTHIAPYIHGPAQSVTNSLNAANNWLAGSLVLPLSSTLSVIAIRVSTKVGTPTAAEITCTLYSSNETVLNGQPNAIVAGPVTGVTWDGGAFVSGSVLRYNFSYVAPSPEARIWAVFKNLNATPTSNYPTIQAGGTGLFSPLYSGGDNRSGQRRTSADGGSTWTTATPGHANFYSKLASGSVIDRMLIGVISGASTPVYGTRQYGIELKPAQSVNLSTISFNAASNVGTVAGTVTGYLRDTTSGMPGTLLATTDPVPVPLGASTHLLSFNLLTPVALDQAKTYVFSLKRTDEAGDGSNYIRFWSCVDYTPEGTCLWGMREIYYNGTSWTYPAVTGGVTLASALLGGLTGSIYTPPVGGGFPKSRLVNV